MSQINKFVAGAIKSSNEQELMKISGKIAAQSLKAVLAHVKPGVLMSQLDRVAKNFIEKSGAQISFTTVDDYKWTTCITKNSEVVHGIPRDIPVKNGDIISVDIGAVYKGMHSDMAITVPVGGIAPKVLKFLRCGRSTLEKAIEKAKVGNRIGDISQTVQENIEGAGYSVVKSLTGHGVGHELHEEPMIPGFGKRHTGPPVLEGMALAIEVIYAQGSGEVSLGKDGWTISTVDGSLAGLFEKTVLVTKSGPIVLTPYI